MIRLDNISIKNYKGIDSLDLEFPNKRFEGDSDIFLLGSKNGVGKTSVLEACSLLYMSLWHEHGDALNMRNWESSLNPYQVMVRAGYKSSNISGTLRVGNKTFEVAASVDSTKGFTFSGRYKDARKELLSSGHIKYNNGNIFPDFIGSLVGLSTEPLIWDSFMYFHSYRKTREGNPELGMMVDLEMHMRRPRLGRNRDAVASTFKLEILRSLMSRGDLFEDVLEFRSDETLKILDSLLATYASGNIGKLRPSMDNTIEFLIQPLDVEQGAFSFDGLSSGQKEIISTLFLIWKYTSANPGIVLIDEPELHLNAEWQQRFIYELSKLVPDNQYIIATHSNALFESVEPEQRIILGYSEAELVA